MPDTGGTGDGGVPVRKTSVWTVVVLAVAALTATGCAPSTPDPGRYVGQTLRAAMQHLASPNVIDLSEPVAARPATYNPDADPGSWFVVVGCYHPNPQKTADLGVIPTTAVTGKIRAAASRYEYDALVPSCR